MRIKFRRGASRARCAALLLMVCRASASAPAVPGSEAVPRTAPVDLSSLEALALAREPSLVASQHTERALAADARTAGSLPPPTVGVDLWQVPLSKPYAVGDAGMLMLSARQEIPAPGSLSMSARAGFADARVQATLRSAAERAIVRDVDRAFADYVEAVARREIRRGFVALSADVASSARRRYAGGGSLAEVARADLEKARLEAELAGDAGDVRSAEAALGALVGRDAEARLGPPESGASQTVSSSLSELEARAAANPEAAAADATTEAASLRARAEQTRSRVPSFSVGLSYFHPVGGMPAGWGASYMMSLPWLSGDAGNRADAAKERALAEGATADSVRRRIRRDVAMAFTAVETAEQRLVRITASVAPAAREAVRISRGAYAAPDGPSLATVLEAERAALEVELDAVAARGALDRALADLDAAVGTRVPRASVSTTPRDTSGDGR